MSKSAMPQNDNPMGHVLLVDDRQVGSLMLVQNAVRQQILDGGGVIVVGSVIDPELLCQASMLCASVGRGGDLRVVDPGRPSFSHTFNPVMHLSPAAVAAHVLNLAVSRGQAGTDGQADKIVASLIQSLVALLQAHGMPYSFLDLGMFVMKPEALESFLAHSLEHLPTHPATKNLEEALQAVSDPFTGVSISQLKSLFSGLAGAMCMIGAGRLGEVFNSYKPDVILFDAIKENKIVFMSSPYIGLGASSGYLRRLLTANIVAGFKDCKSRHANKKVPTLVVFTDPGACNDPSLSDVLKAESLDDLNIWILTRSLAELGGESVDLRECCLTSVTSLLFFNPTTTSSAELCAKFMNNGKADEGSEEGVRPEALLAMQANQYVLVQSEGAVQHCTVAQPTKMLPAIAQNLTRPARPSKFAELGADHFTQTIPV